MTDRHELAGADELVIALTEGLPIWPAPPEWGSRTRSAAFFIDEYRQQAEQRMLTAVEAALARAIRITELRRKAQTGRMRSELDRLAEELRTLKNNAVRFTRR